MEFMQLAAAFLPADLKKVADIDAPASLLEKIEKRLIALPEKLGDLVQSETTGQLYSAKTASKLGFVVGSVEAKYNKMLFIHEYRNYVPLRDEDERALYGIAIRWITELSDFSGNVNLSSLPAISASAQLGMVKATSRFEVAGITSKAINEAMPASSALKMNVESFIEMQQCFDNVKNLIWDEQTQFHPQVLAIYGDLREQSDAEYMDDVAVSWALSCIRNRRNRADAIKKHNKGSARFNDVVKSVYIDILGTESFDDKPDEMQSRRAQELLQGLEMK
jgi:hypothetical protein